MVKKRKNDIEHSFGIVMKLRSKHKALRPVSIMRQILLTNYHFFFLSYSSLGSIIFICNPKNHNTPYKIMMMRKVFTTESLSEKKHIRKSYR